jgi:hypothetical protein
MYPKSTSTKKVANTFVQFFKERKKDVGEREKREKERKREREKERKREREKERKREREKERKREREKERKREREKLTFGDVNENKENSNFKISKFLSFCNQKCFGRNLFLFLI